jgi:hypothetical protein
MRWVVSNLRLLCRAGGAAAAVLAAGCVSSDLSKDADTAGEVAECLPTDTPPPTVIARAIWYPHASGFGSADEHESGVIAVAGHKLWFLEWNGQGKHFDVEHVIDVRQAASLGVVRFGTSAMLVVQSGNLAFDSYELMKGGDVATDPQATQALCDQLGALRDQGPGRGP